MAQTVPQTAAERTRALYDHEGLQIVPIPSTTAEAKAIARYAPGGSKVYTGDDASEDRVKAERLDRFRIIHFASHALISDWMSRRSALVLASGAGDKEDGFLQAREIYRVCDIFMGREINPSRGTPKILPSAHSVGSISER